MGDKRMFNKKIVGSSRFFKLPKTAQLLYYHMGMYADDDGVVEGHNVLKLAEISQKFLKILESAGFVTILNDDLVVYINDWRENNVLRSDRKNDSVYQHLLKSKLPDIVLQEAKQRSDIKGEPRTDNGQSTDCPRTDNGRRKISKDNLKQKEKDKPNGLSKKKAARCIEDDNFAESSRDRSASLHDGSFGFAEFYAAYPRHVDRAQAEKAYRKVNVSNEILLKALDVQKQSKQWQDVQYIPYPATWLNQRRWEDEMPEEKIASQNGEKEQRPDVW